ncbi:MAG: ATP-binding protein [Nitrospira sp.]|nr:ATP-binding protein [Nitrospira sp.]
MLKDLEYKGYPILYVDDEDLALQSFKLQFSNDFTIHTASNSDGAIQILNTEEIAVMITDQRMPKVSGVELLKQVMSTHPDVVRILLTAYTDLDVVIQAINDGNVYRYLSKPYNEDEVRGTIRQAIEHYYLVRERERLYAEKVETMRKIARANRLSAMGIMAAGMAHEINNPLVAISTFLQMLPHKYAEPSKDTEYWEELYRVAVREVERIRLLVYQLLSYSKTAQSEKFEPTSLNEILQEMVVFIENEAKKKGVHVKRTFSPDLPAGMMDRNRMKQVFLNILLNAVQATDRGGTITVASRHIIEDAENQFLQVTISDTGTGISEKNLEKLFTPFFTTKDSEGSGLGLMTSHHIVDEHRGTIDVKSELGKGTTFTLQLPLDPHRYDRRKAHRQN